ncbi:MAG TPA: universal stress protein [Candidatus Polarisedimenticolia bacterium]|nr:universal stress protein [Candidatus Polarisedimenticolia bacterium]
MHPIRRILCPVDSQDLGDRAVCQAAALARWKEAELLLLHVAAPDAARPVFPQTMAEALRAAGVKVRWAVDHGAAVERILAHATAFEADLLVLRATRGDGRQAGGPVAGRLLETASCPVLVVPEPWQGAEQDGRRAPFGQILCPVDFSVPARAGLRAAGLLAHDAGARLTMLHVVPGSGAAGQESRGATDAALESLARLHSEDHLDRLAVDGVITGGSAPSAILLIADDLLADLIVLGVGAGGATSRRVTAGSACPVLSVRSGAPAPTP